MTSHWRRRSVVETEAATRLLLLLLNARKKDKRRSTASQERCSFYWLPGPRKEKRTAMNAPLRTESGTKGEEATIIRESVGQFFRPPSMTTGVCPLRAGRRAGERAGRSDQACKTVVGGGAGLRT